ncbi:MAG: universal stress protein [Desulfuromonadales bacterium]|nr:universal stress protein [Desulfuromonadales bacterium]
MFRKILVCSDLSPASDILIQCVEELKNIGMQEVVLTHAMYLAKTPGLEEYFVDEARSTLERQKKSLEEQGVSVIVEMPFGLTSHAIDETAEKHDVSAIFIGSHGKGILQAATLGSVSANLLHRMRRPVLLTRIALLAEGTYKNVCGRMFAEALFPTDFSETAERALDFLGKIVMDTRCPVTVMHVLEHKDGDLSDARLNEENALFLLEAKKRRLEEQGSAEVTIELVHGNPAEETIKHTEKGKFSIVVMGGQGKGIIKEVFLGSVANQVARQAGTPVLFIPPNR